MINKKKILAIIPARSGSKGLPGKNIKEICGKPLIYWTIKSAKESKYIDDIVISTDSEEIATVAKKLGARVPFLRPKELAADDTPSFDVIKHVLDNNSENMDYIVLLEPTSPLRTSDDIDNAIVSLLGNREATSLVGICKTESQNPAFLINCNSENFISGYENKNIKSLRRQDIQDVFFLEGSIYLSQTKALLQNKTFYHEKTIGYEFPKWKSLEIDDIYDFIMVEALMRYKEGIL